MLEVKFGNNPLERWKNNDKYGVDVSHLQNVVNTTTDFDQDTL